MEWKVVTRLQRDNQYLALQFNRIPVKTTKRPLQPRICHNYLRCEVLTTKLRELL